MIVAEFRSLRWADLFLNALVDPRALYRQISRKEPRPFALSFMVPAAESAIGILTLSLLCSQTTFFYYKITYGWILVFLFHSIIVVISAALMDMAAQFFGLKGNVRELISLVNFSLFPRVFILPAVYIFKVFNFAPLFFYSFFFMGLFIWSALIAVQGISEMHNCGFGRAVIMYLFPALLTGTVLFFMFILLVICGAGYIVG